MKRAMEETERRRQIQHEHNVKHGITPASIVKQIRDLTDRVRAMGDESAPKTAAQRAQEVQPASIAKKDLHTLISALEKEMKAAAQALEFEKAAALRDQLFELRGVLAEREMEDDLITAPAAKPTKEKSRNRR
jgi:excinuclease ABC subunit B